jgi:hypothetical protein
MRPGARGSAGLPRIDGSLPKGWHLPDRRRTGRIGGLQRRGRGHAPGHYAEEGFVERRFATSLLFRTWAYDEYVWRWCDGRVLRLGSQSQRGDRGPKPDGIGGTRRSAKSGSGAGILATPPTYSSPSSPDPYTSVFGYSLYGSVNPFVPECTNAVPRYGAGAGHYHPGSAPSSTGDEMATSGAGLSPRAGNYPIPRIKTERSFLHAGSRSGLRSGYNVAFSRWSDVSAAHDPLHAADRHACATPDCSARGRTPYGSGSAHRGSRSSLGAFAA